MQYLWLSRGKEKTSKEKDQKESQEKEITNPRKLVAGTQFQHQPLLF